MLISNVKFKVIGMKIYMKKDKDTKQETGEVGYMFTLISSPKNGNDLDREIVFPMTSKDFVPKIDLNQIKFGTDVLCDIDIPIVRDASSQFTTPVLHDIRLANAGATDSGLPF